jgi:hypothetical protein
MNAVVRRQASWVEVQFALETKNPNNGQTGNTKLAAIIRTEKRKQVRAATLRQLQALGQLPPLPVVATVTRIAPSNGLDPHDGLGAALKGVFDGIADALGLKSDRDRRVRFVPEQERGPQKYFGVRIRIEAAS